MEREAEKLNEKYAIYASYASADRVLMQLTTTVQSYDSLMEKLEIDISVVEREKERIVELMEDYVLEIHRNLGKIDHNSTITIRWWESEMSSLLYYMRQDDTDIFTDKNEGKVLIMDNPFAQTNASHLLIPLMDMARKTNTQMICLTGLGGDSIYNRFDNIYVLNLIAAGLRGGLQYLKAEHKRGKEPDELITARIQVAEQMELLF